MKSSAYKIVALFIIMGFGSGLLSAFVATLSSAWGWVGLGAILALGVFVSVIIASRLQWLSLNLSVQRCISAALIHCRSLSNICVGDDHWASSLWSAVCKNLSNRMAGAHLFRVLS